MAFGGIGAAAAFVQAASILPRGDYDVATGAWRQGLNAGLAPPVQERLEQQRSAFNHMKIIDATLAGLTQGTLDPDGNDDVGALVTAAAGQGEHGLPTNFGPGRGNWTLDDLARLWVKHENEADPALDEAAAALAAAEIAGGNFPYVDQASTVFIPGANPLFGDVRVVFKARSAGMNDQVAVLLDSILNIHLIYLHSDNL